MRQHLIIAAVLFLVVTALSLASNFIPWDETPLEQSIYALPLGIGLMLETPFLWLMSLWIGDSTAYVNYDLLHKIIPFITGAFYASLYYFIVLLSRKFYDKAKLS